MVTIIEIGERPWIGKWKCGDCGQTIETTESDESDICYKLPDNVECDKTWGYRSGSMFFGERLVGPCTTCKRDSAFFPVGDAA